MKIWVMPVSSVRYDQLAYKTQLTKQGHDTWLQKKKCQSKEHEPSTGCWVQPCWGDVNWYDLDCQVGWGMPDTLDHTFRRVG